MREAAGCTVRLGMPPTAAVQRLTSRCLSLSCLLDPKWRPNLAACSSGCWGLTEHTFLLHRQFTPQEADTVLHHLQLFVVSCRAPVGALQGGGSSERRRVHHKACELLVDRRSRSRIHCALSLRLLIPARLPLPAPLFRSSAPTLAGSTHDLTQITGNFKGLSASSTRVVR
ncbi:unnamed protein product [Pleuronectes platessa]|uniref:Uncharacterized protein n=1 Tax=Pleuronectes platessa TaxID=8262 RepID=A0A9N7UVG3_PLEPL|nr:unnamed protein product [Pleuronectes platessa]